MSPEPLAIDAREVTHRHVAAGVAVPALEHLSLGVAPGEIVAVIGPSGSGKSTLLHLLAGLDRPDEGQISVAGTDWQTLRSSARARFRRRTCGFVLQGMALLPQATAAENVEVPLLLDDVDPTDRANRVAEMLEQVGLSREADKLPDELSGGQQQRVAIARALIARPTVILADEPTGNLDSVTGKDVVRLLMQPARDGGAAVVIVTHDSSIAELADRTVELRSGRIGIP